MIFLRCFIVLLVFLPAVAFAAEPEGFLDHVGERAIAGWARDPDFDGPIPIRIFRNGKFIHQKLAKKERADVGAHAFHWGHPPLREGRHEVRVFAMDLDAQGQETGTQVEISGSPKAVTLEGAEYKLTSPDGQVEVIFDKRFGGAITRIYDREHMGDLCLVDWEQAGAMFQPAFWLLPRHDQLPPYCSDRNDMWYDNPTLAGFVGDGWAGNPIGIFGTDTKFPDPNEFIRYENEGKKVRFKSRFIRYDYCFQGTGAPMDNREHWNTDFFLEQHAYFHDEFKRTMVLDNVLSFVGDEPRTVSTRQLPVIFAFHLPNVAYVKDGEIKIENIKKESGIRADSNWAALVADGKNVGIGMVLAPTFQTMIDKARFGYGEIGLGLKGERLSILYPCENGIPDIRTMGELKGAHLQGDRFFVFEPGGSFTWTVHYPIGELEMIADVAKTLLSKSH